nr:hypothetical protein CFP56_28645 [Quercus suber]
MRQHGWDRREYYLCFQRSALMPNKTSPNLTGDVMVAHLNSDRTHLLIDRIVDVLRKTELTEIEQDVQRDIRVARSMPIDRDEFSLSKWDLTTRSISHDSCSTNRKLRRSSDGE